ncbi:glycerol kinase [Citrus sinensis]|uniref:Glycerol kinase n=3 Tax=Citrus TaxID=2706 RepID=A0ACB8IB82_CITSI|nr:uncharacterized protein LOC18033919 [Citrus x clementina]XP_006486576.1 uncharacterized protein LOC102608745 [Citrus sinensis]ESR35643.1 hypothetical protein CICLE_v10028691mg [Citrus x clementina]KAH9654746.1 glycerol kinase [Citrus sinensis]KAH9694284.1 glycerol kinase [Citrus sinensis]KDO68390.1 hypothetical protein CISIN_1g017644mg [Citrus sinensis]
MALAANSIISQNRTLNSLSFPLPKPKLATIHHHPKEPKLNLQFQVQPNNQSHLRTSPTSCVAVQSSDPTSSAATNSWSEFAKNVSGEWDGFGADFTTEGNPIELPENAVPEAYREWEVKVFDWQTQCPTLAQPEDNQVMFYKSIKLLPTVGCEADAATHYSIDVRNIGGVHNKVSAFAYQSTGCYVAFWPTGDYDAFEVEHCLINPQDKESRVRIIQVFRVQEQRIILDKFRVFCEQWYGPFRNGDQLGGCAIRDSGFAATDALKASEVIGVWQGPSAIASFTSSCEDFLRELLGDSVQKSIRDESNLILLPRQLWCSIKESEDGETMCEAGWLFDQGHAISSKCIFSGDAKLKEISLAQETAVSEGV